jgi:hypothetical protein
MVRRLRPYLLPALFLAVYGGFLVRGRLELHATDPSKVVLAAGRPQLVEFFAFW